ncbi:MAG: J domain-containing protein [Kiloniellales bacterium]
MQTIGPVPPERRCQIPGCAEAGAYRAPRSRDRVSEYYWFCLDHVRQYNAAWDYYHGMSAAEIEAHIRHDTIWRRPSWRIGCGPNFARAGLSDEYGLFENDDRVERAEAGGNGHGPRPAAPGEMQALAVLDLKPPVSFDKIKKRYKDLVKRHHPDANGGDRAAEERLKLVIQAYTSLRSVYCP